MSGKVLKTIYILKGKTVDNSNVILLELEKQRGITLEAYIVHFSLYNLYELWKLHKSFRPLILSPKSHISVLSALRPFRKYIVYNTFPGIENTILYNGDNLSAI